MNWNTICPRASIKISVTNLIPKEKLECYSTGFKDMKIQSKALNKLKRNIRIVLCNRRLVYPVY